MRLQFSLARLLAAVTCAALAFAAWYHIPPEPEDWIPSHGYLKSYAMLCFAALALSILADSRRNIALVAATCLVGFLAVLALPVFSRWIFG